MDLYTEMSGVSILILVAAFKLQNDKKNCREWDLIIGEWEEP